MIFERIRAFVSSSMEELEPERLAVKQALDELKIDAWLFERDAGARPETPAATFREELGTADIYVGLFANKYGAYTVEEFELATTLGKDRLVYERRSALDGRDPRLEAFLARAGHVENGVTIRRFETASQLGAMVKDDLAAWQARRIRDQRTEMAQRRPSPGRDVEQSQLEILRRKVEQFWVDGVLKHSLYDEVLIDLGTEATTEAIDHPWATVLELPDHSTRELSSSRKIADIFEEAGRSLLVLGEPGAGKTTCLLDLARSLLATEHEGITPVVLNLSSFGSRSGPLFDWLIEEIRGKYQIPKQLCRRWLTEGRLLLLLDGLDEVNESRRADCVRAINEYAESQTVPGLVVCSRVAEYVALPVRIKAWGAIRLRPLEAAQIQSYLVQIGPRVAGLTSALDTDESLRSLATSPLLLNLMALAYADAPPEAPAAGAGTTPEQRRYALFDRYIQTMFARKGVRDRLQTETADDRLPRLAGARDARPGRHRVRRRADAAVVAHETLGACRLRRDQPDRARPRVDRRLVPVLFRGVDPLRGVGDPVAGVGREPLRARPGRHGLVSQAGMAASDRHLDRQRSGRRRRRPCGDAGDFHLAVRLLFLARCSSRCPGEHPAHRSAVHRARLESSTPPDQGNRDVRKRGMVEAIRP